MSWNLPPGCRDSDIDRAFGGKDPSPASQDVGAILDKAGFRWKFVESILQQIAEEEEEMNQPDPDRLREDRYDWDHDR